MGMDAIISLPGLATTAITGTLTLTKTGATPQTATFPDASIEVQGTHEVQSSNWQARNHGLYTAIASATVTDPSTPAAGHEFTTLVRNGTLTTSRGSYAVSGTLVRSVWHSGSWTDYQYPHIDASWTWTAAQTIDRGTGALPAWPAPTTLVLGLANADGVNSRIYQRSYGANGLALETLCAAGTRTAPTAVADLTALFQVVSGGYDGTTWQSASGYFRLFADGLWSGTNRGTGYIFDGTPNGSTVRAEWMRLQGGNLVQSSGAAWSSGGLSGEIAGKHLISGYDTTSNIGYIRSANNGTAFTELRLAGSSVTLYAGSASSVLGATLDSSGNLGIGVTPATGAKLQLGTGSANGIGFQSGGVVDTVLYRDSAAVLAMPDGNVGGVTKTGIKLTHLGTAAGSYASVDFVADGSLNGSLFTASAANSGTYDRLNLGTISAHGIALVTNNIRRIRIDSSGNFHLRGGTPTTPSAFTAWTGTATRTSIATGSATVANCAEAIKALIDDLKSCGVLP